MAAGGEGEVGQVIRVEVEDLCDAQDLACPENQVAYNRPFEGQEEEKELIDLQTCEIESCLAKQNRQEELVKVDAVDERHHCRSEYSDARIGLQKVEVPVPVEIFMDRPIPLPRVLVEVGCVPKVLVELAISEAAQLRVEVGAKLEDEEEHREVECHDREVPAHEGVGRGTFVEQADEREQDASGQLIGDELQIPMRHREDLTRARHMMQRRPASLKAWRRSQLTGWSG